MVLRSFRVANHRSIRDEQELSLLSAYNQQPPVVPVTAVYGANASGKSNLIDALRFMQSAVRTSYASWEPGSGIPRRPFRLDPAVLDRPSLYVVDLSLDGVRYSYGFAIDEDRVQEEWLYAYPHTRRRVIFERSGATIRLGSTLPDHRSRETTLAGLTRDNTLFLSAAAHANQSEAMPVYEWFRNGVQVLKASSRLEPPDLEARLEPGAVGRTAIIELIRAADLGITDVRTVPPADESSIRDLESRIMELRYRMMRLSEQEPDSRTRVEIATTEVDLSKAYAAHARTMRRSRDSPLRFLQGKHEIPLTYNEQSEGTRAWVALLGHVLASLERGSMLVIDEIDNSLHPRLTARLVELFQDSRTNPKAAQLVFATHDASLLGTSFGREVLQRDQIWFVEKDTDGATTLFPLTDFHPRKEENTERRYLGGSYGAVPSVFSDTLVEAYLAARPELLDDTA